MANTSCFVSYIILLANAYFVDGLVIPTSSPFPVKYRHDYVYLDGFNAFVKVNLKRKTWQQAKFICEAEGSSLAVIRTRNEAAVLKKLLESFPILDRIVWVGLQDLVSEGEFGTIDGEPIANVFNEWEKGEPNDDKGKEDCVLFTHTGQLNDENCANKHTFLCKKDETSVIRNEACDNFDRDYKQVLNGQQCIKFHSSPKTWEEAYATCIAEESNLAVINSQDEADLFKEELAKYPLSSLKGNFNKDAILIGFHDKFTEGDYVTVTNQKLYDSGYEVWADGQPDNRGNEENCGSMFRNGKLNDISCSIRAMFICEKKLRDPLDVSLDSRIQEVFNF